MNRSALTELRPKIVLRQDRPVSINPLGPLKLLNFNDRVDKPTQKHRLNICLSCEKAELGICHCLLLPSRSKVLDCL